jgi:2-keto-4-pentenoate hydratase/2-oxohepta-3-ene-1,7-dioic acid hydratase in catechol pathway
MRLYRTTLGLARGEGDDLLLLDLPHRDIEALLADGVEVARTARVSGRMGTSSIELRNPISRPTNIYVVGANYRDHVLEAGIQMPTSPSFLRISANPAVLADPGSQILLPIEAAEQVDYEAELAVLIGVGGKDIPVGEAWKHVGGLTAANDVSARHVQFQGMDHGAVVDAEAVRRSKSFPTFKPFGPAVVTPDEFTPSLDLAITTHVNGGLRQRSRTGRMLFSIAEIIAGISAAVPVACGDVILTGTPAGVGLASKTYLRPGDTIDVAIEGLGRLRNTVASSARDSRRP